MNDICHIKYLYYMIGTSNNDLNRIGRRTMIRTKGCDTTNSGGSHGGHGSIGGG